MKTVIPIGMENTMMMINRIIVYCYMTSKSIQDALSNKYDDS